jgi:hypothetical protein
MEVIGIVVLSTFGYYALKLMTSFRKGMLERGWRLVTFGAIILALAQIPFLISLASPSLLMSTLRTVGNLSRFLGIVLLTLGFRDQYKIWRIDKKEISELDSENAIQR